MEFKDLFDLEKIKEAVPEEVLDEAVKSVFDLKPIMLHTPEMNELVYNMPLKADFNEIKDFIKYEENEATNTYEITVPSFDERKLPEFEVDIFRKNHYDCFPERGFFITGTSRIVIKPLGLIKVEIHSYPVVRVDKDIRYTQTSSDIRERGFNENLYFYYDYNSKQYVRVYSDKLEKCKYEMQKDPKVVSDFHETVQEYIKREELLEAIIKRIYKLVISYLPELNKWHKLTYDDGQGNVTISTVKKYLKDYEVFLDQPMSQNLKVKLIYANVTTREYLKLLEQKSELKKYISYGLTGLAHITEGNKLTPDQEVSYKLSTDNFSQGENDTVHIITNEIIQDLKKFKEVRSSQFPDTTNKNLILKGYVDYDLETGEVFPNIVQLQRRTSLTEDKEDFRTEAEYTEKIIQELKKLKD